jgi:hypothetical protein
MLHFVTFPFTRYVIEYISHLVHKQAAQLEMKPEIEFLTYNS